MAVESAESLPDGWLAWLEWSRTISPENQSEINAAATDQGRHLGYVGVVGRRNPAVRLEEPIVSIPARYIKQSLIRT